MDIRSQSSRIVVGLCSAAILVCCAVDLIPFDILGDHYYEAKELLTIAIILIALSSLSFENLREKGILFVLLCWRFLIFVGNMLALETWMWSSFLIISAVLLVFFCFRVSAEKCELSYEPDREIAAYALVPVHTYLGLFQKIFMFWHAPYETRVLVYGNSFWCVHRGKFKRFDRSAWRWKDSVRWVSIGRRLTDDEISKANSLVGKRSIQGIKDCRKLMVAGNPKKYMEG